MSDSEKFPTNPLISVVIINLNGLDYILDCVDSVFKSNYRNFEVILIDNNSSDNSSTKCKERFPKIRLIQNKQNLAMAARNKGIDAAQGDFMVFLDADTVVTSNWIDVLLNSYKKHGRGLYQGKLLKKDNHSIIESCGDMTNIFSTGFARGRGQKDTKQFEKNNISIEFSEYVPTPYPQLFTNKFLPNLSIIDLIMNMGNESSDIIKSNST